MQTRATSGQTDPEDATVPPTGAGTRRRPTVSVQALPHTIDSAIRCDAYDIRADRLPHARKPGAQTHVLTADGGVHASLVAFVQVVPEEQLSADTRFRPRLRLDTYGHYPKHARAIRTWRASRAATGD